MAYFKCCECDYECRINMGDKSAPPDFCPIDANEVQWVLSIEIKPPTTNKCTCERCTGIPLESLYEPEKVCTCGNSFGSSHSPDCPWH